MLDDAPSPVADHTVEQRVRAIEASALHDNVGALLDQAAAEAADQLAWNFFESGERETYASLRDRTTALARGLVERGIRKGTHVAVMLPNIAAFPLSWLALARLGAVAIFF